MDLLRSDQIEDLALKEAAIFLMEKFAIKATLLSNIKNISSLQKKPFLQVIELNQNIIINLQNTIRD